MDILKLTTIAVVMGLTACASTEVKPYRSAPQILVNKTQGTLNLNIPQYDIEAVVPVVDSTAAVAQYGLVGIMVGGVVESSINSNSAELYQKLMVPIQNKMLAFKFDSQAEKMVKPQPLTFHGLKQKTIRCPKKLRKHLLSRH